MQQASCEVVSGENTEVVEESSVACASDSKDGELCLLRAQKCGSKLIYILNCISGQYNT